VDGGERLRRSRERPWWRLEGPLGVALGYGAFGIVWILLSDWIVSHLYGPAEPLALAQTVKGLFYVTVTGALVYWLAGQSARRVERERTWYRALFEVSPDAVFVVGSDGGLVDANEAAVDLCGVPREELARRTFLDLVPAADRAAAQDLLARAYEVATRGERALVGCDGQVIPVEVATRPLRRGAGRCVLVTVRDLSPERAADNALRASREMLSRAETLAGIGSWEFDVASGEVTWSEGLYALFGKDSAAPAPRFGANDGLMPPADIVRLRAAVVRAMQDGTPYDMELMIIREDGELRHVLVHGRAELGPDGRAARLFGSLLDVTERRRVERERRHLMAAIEQAAAAIIITDAEGTIEYVNPAFEEISGFPRAEAIGRNPRIKKSGQASDEVYQAMWRDLTAGRRWSGRLVNRRRDGSLYTAELSIAPVRDEGGGIVRYVAVEHDVSREVELERQLLHAQKLDAVGRLAGGIAHDFNNILTAINGYAEFAIHGLPSDSPYQTDLREILASAGRAATLTRQLLGFARKQTASPRVVDLNVHVARTLAMLKRVIGEQIEVSWRPEAGLWSVHIDLGQLDQVLTNLVINARDAIEGVGTVTVATANVASAEGAIAGRVGPVRGDFVRLTVRDDGHGADADTVAKVFEPFFTTKPEGAGTGLGLSTAYGIVKQNGGLIDFESEPGVGTVVSVYLPRHLAQPTGDGPADAPGGPRGGSETLLVVEDEAPLRALLVRLLRSLGYAVLSAGTPREAIALVDQHRGTIDLLVTDVVMPQMDGRALCAALRERRPGLRCLFISGYASDAITDRGMLGPDVQFLQKPFTLDVLARRIREVLAT